MATGTTTDFQLTRSTLIELAFSLIGVTEPTNGENALAIKVLNSLIRHLDSRGTWLWGVDNTESTLTTVASQREYAAGSGASLISTDILRLTYCAVLEGSDDYRDLTIYTNKESLKTSLKSDTNGEPEACYLERGVTRDANILHLFPTPNAAYTIKYNYRKPLFEFDAASDNPDFPQEFQLSLQKLLAVELAPHFGKPLNERQLNKAEAERDFEIAKSAYEEDPSYVTMKAEYY